MERFACKKWDRDNYICPKVTKMGSIIGRRIDYDGVAEAHTQKKNCPIYPPPPPPPLDKQPALIIILVRLYRY